MISFHVNNATSQVYTCLLSIPMCIPNYYMLLELTSPYRTSMKVSIFDVMFDLILNELRMSILHPTQQSNNVIYQYEEDS